MREKYIESKSERGRKDNSEREKQNKRMRKTESVNENDRKSE